MKYNFLDFLNESRSNCRSKFDLAERINKEVEAVSKISDGNSFMDRLAYTHQLEITKLALKCGTLLNKGEYTSEITDTINSLKD